MKGKRRCELWIVIGLEVIEGDQMKYSGCDGKWVLFYIHSCTFKWSEWAIGGEEEDSVTTLDGC